MTGAAVRRLGATVLAGEALVLFFFILVGSRLRPDDATAIAVVGGIGALAALVLCGLLRHRWAIWAGWALQVGLVATGLVVSTMYILGLIFAVLWLVALRLAANIEEGVDLPVRRER
jgi:Protein of unknown function (DUF4233)